MSYPYENKGMNSITPDTETRVGRMFAAGRATVTFTSPRTGEHITVNAKCRRPDESGKWVGSSLADAKLIFFTVPNESGFGDKIGKYTDGRGFTADAAADAARVYCAKALIRLVQGQDIGTLVAAEESRCGKCGRALTDPTSIERGIGPECFGAETGSTHQTKVRPAASVARPAAVPAGDFGHALRERTQVEEDHGNRMEREMVVAEMAARESELESYWAGSITAQLPKKTPRTSPRRRSDGRDKQGVPYGAGDWKARKEFAAKAMGNADAAPVIATNCNRDDLYDNGIPY